MLNIFGGRRDLAIALAGRTTSVFGDGVALIALTLRLQADGAQPYEVAVLLGAGGIPMLVLAQWVGRLVDSHDSRRLLLGAGVIEVAGTVPLIVIHSVVWIVALVGLLGAAASVSSSTWSALVPRIVGEDQIAAAVSAQQSLNALVLVGAPAVGGLLAGTFGAGPALAVDAASFVVVTVAATLIRTRRRPEGRPSDSQPTPARSGFAILRGDRILAPLTVGVALVVLLVGMVDVVLVFLVRATLHASGTWYGAVEAVWMAGIVGGSLAAGRRRTDQARRWATIAGIGIVCAALAPFAVVATAWMLVPLSVLGGIGNGYAATSFSTLVQTRTTDAERGRVSAAAGAILGGGQGASLLIGGAIASALSPRTIYATAGLLGLAATLVIAGLSTRAAGTARDGAADATDDEAAEAASW